MALPTASWSKSWTDKGGVEEKEVNVRNKPPRGAFTAAYLLQCMEAVGGKDLRL